jgi:hypothetical protein
MLDQKTIERVAREWDRRLGAKDQFTIDALPVLGADGNERDIVIVRPRMSEAVTSGNVAMVLIYSVTCGRQ